MEAHLRRAGRQRPDFSHCHLALQTQGQAGMYVIHFMISISACLCLALILAANASAADWPQWGGRNARNFVSAEKNLPAEFHLAARAAGPAQGKKLPPKNIKWTAGLGTQTYASPTVAGGRIIIGTNDERLDDPRLPKTQGGLLLCFQEATGERLWQLRVPRLKTRNTKFNYDNMGLGICSSAVIEGNRAYVVSSRGEVLCLDVAGQSNGNDGPYTDEGLYMARTTELPDKPGRFSVSATPPDPAPVKLQPTDGDIVWLYDFIKELDVWPQDAVDCSILVYGDYLIACVSNGVDQSHKNVPSPNAPDLIVLEKKTGRLVAVNDQPIGSRIFHGEWSSPSLIDADGRPLIVWGGGDGVCYAFDARIKPVANGATGRLERVWWFDCNPEHNKFKDGKPLPYSKDNQGPSEIIATPVTSGNRIYVAVGQDSRHGEGPGCFSCIDATGRGDITQSGKVWQCFEVDRSFSSASVVDGLVFIADYSREVRCLDAATGVVYWTHKLPAHPFGSTLAADGKVYIGDESGRVTVLACSREKQVLAVNRLDAPIFTTPVAANGVLYIATQKTLYAIQSQP